MNITNIVVLTNEDTTTARVVFHDGGQEYVYRVLNTMAVEAGNTVVVKARNEFKMATVVEVDEESDIDLEASYNYEFIYAVLDTTIIDLLKESEKDQVKALKKKQRRKLQMQKLEELGMSVLLEGDK